MNKGIEWQVETVLTDEPATRNDDRLLTVRIWQRFWGVRDILSVQAYLNGDYPTQDDVKRYRADIQNVQHRLIPTDWNVAKHRKWKEDEWRAVLGYPPVGSLRHPQKTSGLIPGALPKPSAQPTLGVPSTNTDPKRFL